MRESHSWGKLKSYLFVGLQFFFLGYLFFSGPALADSISLQILELAGLAVGIWAVLAMRIGNFHILPDPLARSRFVNRGPYRIVRHPMYLALLLVTLSLILSDFSLWRGLAWGLLLLTLLLKMSYEEKLLLSTFPHYRAYLQDSFRLIPGVY